MLSARAAAPLAPPKPHTIPNKRAIISRRTLSGELEALVAEHGTGDKLRPALIACLRRTLADGREEVRKRFEAGGSGEDCVRENCYLADRLIGSLADFTVLHIFPTANPTSGEVFDISATGGYGRGELARRRTSTFCSCCPTSAPRAWSRSSNTCSTSCGIWG